MAVFLTVFVSMPAFAEPLTYQGNQRSDMQSNASQGDLPLVPVTYGTNYEAQFHPYASFMQSPYSQGQAQQLNYGRPPAGGPGPNQPQPGGDPYQANEVSPYSRYSPYLEVIGEGSDYNLGIDDVVTVIVRNQPDFSGRFVVDPNGNIQYNFVGDIPAAGKTKEELKEAIVEGLKQYVRYPEVAVMISEYRSKTVFVFGFVNAPGKYAMKGNNITVKDAIVAAGLPRMDGSLKRVYVIRPSDMTETGKAAGKKVDLHKLIQKGDAAENFILKPGDTLVVHQRYFDRFVNAFSRLVGPLFQTAAVYELGWGQRSGFFVNED
jgi:polysaccharide export outer membrane protein